MNIEMALNRGGNNEKAEAPGFLLSKPVWIFVLGVIVALVVLSRTGVQSAVPFLKTDRSKALELIQAQKDALFLFKGDSAFVENYWDICEYRGNLNVLIDFVSTDSSNASQADRLNGLEWDGLININMDGVYRQYSKFKHQWGEWSSKRGPVLTYGVQKKNGEWSFLPKTTISFSKPSQETVEAALAAH